MKMDSLDLVFKALAHPIRRRILDLVADQDGCNVNQVCSHFEVSRISVLRHINVLEEAGLLTSEKRWRDRLLYFNAVPIQLIYDRWTSKYSALWARDLARIKYAIESEEEPL
ncbi:MAG: helix-turn-helix domain-containing protein [Deltaproteobacteria bacterium]|nr:helix-turn-helix domain-containing protein [Deltaproteobacteria bacterium]